MRAKKLTELALLTALALIIFVVELQIPNPIPIPSVKLGLANVITVYAVYHYKAREVFLIVLVRIFLAAIISGNMIALLYSLAGGLLFLAGMLLLRKVLTEKFIWLCSVFGAVLHNIGQIVVAIFITQTPAIIAYLPFFADFRLYSGGFYGMLCTADNKQKPC